MSTQDLAARIEHFLGRRYPVSLQELAPEEGGGSVTAIPQLGRRAFMAVGETPAEALEALDAFLKEGKKLEISIPNLILNSPLPIQLACLRGIADTDFSLVFKKDFKGVHRDPYIQLGCSSMILVNQISGILSKINIHSTLILNQKAKIKGRKREYLKHYLNVHG